MASVRIWALDDFCLKECQSKKGTKSSQSMSFSLPQYAKICDEKAERIIIDGFMHTIYHYACAGLCILFISRLSLHSTKASFSLVFFLLFFLSLFLLVCFHLYPNNLKIIPTINIWVKRFKKILIFEQFP